MLSSVVPTRLSAALIASTILLPAAPALGQEQVLGTACREMRTLDAMEYWFWDTFSGLVEVHDINQERVGRFEIDNRICFRIALITVENPQQKNAGIRQAVGELIMWLAGDDVEGRVAGRANARLERITGEQFDTYDDWTEWWEPRRDFVLWSDDEDRLIVVTSAMEAGEAIHEEAMELSAEEYWFYAGRGWILESESVGNYTLGTVLIPPHDFNFRIEADQLRDRGAKQQGFRRALENLVVDGLLSPQLSGDGLESIIEQIAALTEETYAERGRWVAWWNTNGARLVLSASGDKLIVRQ